MLYNLPGIGSPTGDNSMPTHHREIRMPEGEKVSTKKGTERFKTGPRGEKRPMSVTSNAVRVMEIATGLREEEYVDGMRRPPKKRVRII